VKFSRYRPGIAQRVGWGKALLFHDRGNRRGWVVSSTPRPHFTAGENPVPILQVIGPQGRSGREENLVPTRIRSRTVQPLVSRYTDWATHITESCPKNAIVLDFSVNISIPKLLAGFSNVNTAHCKLSYESVIMVHRLQKIEDYSDLLCLINEFCINLVPSYCHFIHVTTNVQYRLVKTLE